MRLSQILNESNDKLHASSSNNAASPNKLKGQPKYVGYIGSRPSLFANIAINSLFGFGLYCLYKDYSISNGRKDSAGTVKIIEEHSNKVSKKSKSEVENQSSVYQLIHSLSYRDLSAFSVTMGFLGYITDVSRQSFGKKSIIFRVSLFSLLLFPSFTYVFYQYNFDKARRKLLDLN